MCKCACEQSPSWSVLNEIHHIWQHSLQGHLVMNNVIGCNIKYLFLGSVFMTDCLLKMEVTSTTRYFGRLILRTSCYISKVGLNLMTTLPHPQKQGLKKYTPTWLCIEFMLYFLVLYYFCLDFD